jgi:hypothetical protein
MLGLRAGLLCEKVECEPDKRQIVAKTSVMDLVIDIVICSVGVIILEGSYFHIFPFKVSLDQAKSRRD